MNRFFAPCAPYQEFLAYGRGITRGKLRMVKPGAAGWFGAVLPDDRRRYWKAGRLYFDDVLTAGEEERGGGRDGFAVHFDDCRRAVEQRDGAAGGLIGEFNGRGVDNASGAEVGIQANDSRRGAGRGRFDGMGSGREPDGGGVGDGPGRSVDCDSGGRPGEADSGGGIDYGLAADLLDAGDGGGRAGKQRQVGREKGVLEVEGDALEVGGGLVDQLEELGAGLLSGRVDVLVTLDDVEVDGEAIAAFGQRTVTLGYGRVALRAEVPYGGGVLDQEGEAVGVEERQDAGCVGADGFAHAGVEAVV